MSSAHHGDPTTQEIRWRSSTYSGGNNECVEFADNLPHLIPVRDSKRPSGPTLSFERAAWQVFVADLPRLSDPR